MLPRPQEKGRQHGHEGKGEDERSHEGKDHGNGHGAKHLPLNALEGEDRKVDDNDDPDSEKNRPQHLPPGFQDDMRHLVLARLF